MSKGRPTPKRREAQKVRRALAPAATKEARKEQREATRKLRAQQRAAFIRGDESALPLRDRGPVKRLARDVVDARRSIAEYLLPVVMLVLALNMTGSTTVQAISAIVLYVVMFAAIIDTALLARRIRRQASEKFPNESTKGITSYVVLRSSQIRRLRVPRPRIERGAKV